ncbi:hypothetical protein [Phenylobacterium sp.]|nr:hypothetical protein [Phenylobacterium sp.]MBX3484807.1 hypothetical protein [Phenylobacterium sp.]
MPDMFSRALDLARHGIDLFAARPLTCTAGLIVALLYLNLMTSGPRIR